MIKRTLTALVLGVALLFKSGGGGHSQDYNKGLKAFKKDDYATALREWSVLVNRGDAGAQHYLGLGVRPRFRRHAGS